MDDMILFHGVKIIRNNNSFSLTLFNNITSNFYRLQQFIAGGPRISLLCSSNYSSLTSAAIHWFAFLRWSLYVQVLLNLIVLANRLSILADLAMWRPAGRRPLFQGWSHLPEVCPLLVWRISRQGKTSSDLLQSDPYHLPKVFRHGLKD